VHQEVEIEALEVAVEALVAAEVVVEDSVVVSSKVLQLPSLKSLLSHMLVKATSLQW
jgi:hypothetical protein